MDLRLVRFFDLVPRGELLDGRLRVLDDGFAVGQKRHLPDAGRKPSVRAVTQERLLRSCQIFERRLRPRDALAVLGIGQLLRGRKIVDQLLHLPGGLFVFIVGLARRLEAADKLAV